MNLDLTLPMPAIELIPHRPPMLLVERLLSYEPGGSGTVEACLDSSSFLASKQGVLDEVAMVEMLAQGYAAIKGYDDLLCGKPVQEGFLVGIRKFRMSGRVSAGERLVITINTVGSFEGFAVIEGQIRSAEEIIATGFIKLWLVDKDKMGVEP